MNRILLTAVDFLSKTKMPKSYRLFFTVLFLFSGIFLNAQVANYSFSQASGTYSALTGSPSVAFSSGWDDSVSSPVSIGFTFTYNGVNYTDCSINSNGFVTFGGTFSANNEFNPISVNTAYAGAISALGRDLVSNSSTVSYSTLGSSPNRVFVVQWTNARRYSGGSQNADFNFQIRLNEGSNTVQIIYGACATSYNTDLAVQVGLRGASNADFNNRTTTNNWPVSTAGGTNSATCRTGKGAGELPTNGLTYTWTPPCVLPTVYAMTGAGGSFCSTLAGSTIGLANSQTGVSYQLLRGSVAVGSAVAGTTGNAISFGTFNTTGTYTVLATRNSGSCTSTMSGSVTILSYSSPPTPVATATNVSCPADATGTITVTNAAAPASLAFLSASNQYVDFGTTLLSNRAAFTVEGWIKFDPANYVTRMALFGQNDVIEIAFENNNLRCWTYNGGSVDLPLSSFPAGNAWHHIAVTGDGTAGGLKIYLDGGAPVTGGNATANYGSDTNYTAKIGWGIMDAGGIGLTGEVFKLGFWNRALTAAEITNMSSGFVVYDASQSGLLAGYSFNEGSGTTVAGVGSVAPTGTFVNGPVWTDPYVYSWTSTPGGFVSSLKNITGLSARTYNLTTSLKGCTNSGSWVVNATNTAPTITTTGTVPAVCFSAGAQMASLAYTVTSSNPTSYSIDWNAAANTAGLADQASTAFAFSAGGGNLNTIVITAGTPSGSYTGTMTITNASGCTATQVVTVTVNAIVTAGTIGTAQTICNGATPAALTSSTAGTGSGAITYEWQTNASGSYVTIGGATSATYSPPALTATTSYQRRTVSVSGGTTCYSGYTTPVTITVNAVVTAGTIGTDQTICNGATPAALTSTTAGTGSGAITYEWQTNASGSYVTIGGATSATYSPPALTATTSYQRRTVSVSGGTTCYSGYTTPVTITVNATVTAGTIGTDQTICNGATPAALTSSTAGTGSGAITYEWQTNASGSYVTIGGATSATYSPPALTATTSYQRRTVSVSGGTTCYSGYTTPVTITVNTTVTAGAIGTAQTICNGSTPAALTSTTAGTGSGVITYEWQTNASGSYVTIGGATSATYSPPALTATTGYQRRTVSVSGGTTCYSGYTTPVTITVNAAVTAGAIGTAQTICNGSTPTALTSTTAGTGSGVITYEWQTNASGSYVTIGGATSATYSPPALTATTSYQRRTVSVSGGTTCYSGYTTPVTITVNAAVTAGTIGTDQTICNGATPAALTSTTTGTGSGAITYEWQTNASGSYVTIGGATSATYSPPALTATTSYQRRTVSVSGGTTCYSGYTTPVTITVNAVVTAGIIGTAQTICNGATPAALTSSTAGTGSGVITYEWQTDASGSYVTIGGATSATYSPPALTATTSYQRRTVSVSGGTTCYSGYTTPVTITVNAAVTAGTIGTAQTICNGSTPAALTSTTAGTGSGAITYEWQTNASGSYVTIGGATSATYSPPALTATTSYQRRTVSVSGGTTCYSGYTTPVTITVNATVTAGTIGTDQTICNGATPAALTSSTAGTGSGVITYEWQTNASGSYVTIGGATSATYSPPALTATTSYQRRTVSVSGGTTCYSGYTTPVSITVNATVTAGAIGTAQAICNGATPAALTSTTAGTGSGVITYEWQTNASGSYVTIGGATSATYSPPALTATTSYQRRTVSVSGGTTCYSGYTAPVTITVNPLPTTPTASATAQPTCVVPTGTITVTAPTGAGMSYSVDGSDYSNTSGVFPGLAVGAYIVTVKNGSGCFSLGAPVSINAPITNTWDGIKWSKTGDATPPTATDIVVFNGPFTITTQLNACSCQINPGINVVVGVAGATNDTAILKVVNGLNVDPTGSLTFENNASLIQVNDAAVNTGDIAYRRNAKPMKNFDYTYWSSPVVGQKLNVLSPDTLWDKYFSYVNNGWKIETGVTPMVFGKGYIIRVPKPNFWPDPMAVTYAQPVEFIGVPNNGAKTLAIGSIDGDGNLVGNPYPSPMSADAFLAANNKEIDGTIYFWTHNTAISNLVYSSTDYASYNGVGGVNTLPAGSGGTAPDGNIAAGQSFFTVTKKAAGSTGAVTFNNSMRVGVNNSNAQFFKGTKSKTATVVKHRVWLNLANDNGAFKQTLVGYVTGATLGNDIAFDGESFDGNKYIDFYSINESKNLVIQGRALPFEKTDKVPLGYKTTVEGTFVISIDKVDGVLASQTVFIEDKVTNVIHNLKNGAYSFSTLKGVFNDRFVLRYMDNTPVVTDPIVKDPVITDPIVKDPVVKDPVITDPVVKDPVVTDPIVKDPIVTDPVVKDPIIKDPVVKDPIVTDPVVKDPVVTDPIVKDPIVTTPVVTDPIVLDPTKGGATLGTDGFENKGRGVVVFVKDHQIKINSFDETIGMVMVYDLRGRLLYQNEHVNKNEFVINNLDSREQFLIVLTQLINGKWITKEIVF